MTLVWRTASDRHGPPREIGSHGSVDMFVISVNVVDYSKYTLRGFLPSFKTELGEHDSAEKAQEVAAAVFARWLVRAELAPVRKEGSE